jgi:voltage-gated potassium channel
VVKQGDPGDALCIVVEGAVDVHRDDRLVRQMSEGQYFGEISLIDGEPRSATVTAAEDVVLLKLGSSDFESLLSVPAVARTVLRNLARLCRGDRDPHDPEVP